ncbi:MAG: hypothetical protein RLZZ08_776 [Pseudomonadota bacterium]|jgi:UrcA family protein
MKLFQAIITTSLGAAIGATAITAAIVSPAAAETVRKVSYADLDLTTRAGQHRLQDRIDSAARAVCRSGPDGSYRSNGERYACFKQSRRDVAVRVAALKANGQLGG